MTVETIVFSLTKKAKLSSFHMSGDQKAQAIEEARHRAMWQIPYACDSCGQTIAVTCETIECTLCHKPVDGERAMRAFWQVLHDEKAWKDWKAKQEELDAPKNVEVQWHDTPKDDDVVECWQDGDEPTSDIQLEDVPSS